MKILYIHNNYATNNSGEEHAAHSIARLLVKNGHQVEWYLRSSDELNSAAHKSMAFFTGIWNPAAVKQVLKRIDDFQPDVVQIQNLYPLISPAIIKAIKSRGVPIVMRCPNYRLFCPSGLHLNPKGQVCEKCLSPGKELHCILNNCENNVIKSTGYALRNFAARTIWDLYRNIDIYIVQSQFQKDKFIANGIPGSKIEIVPGISPEISSNGNEPGNLVSFVGRISPEKGIVEFIEAARILPEIPFAIAGSPNPQLSSLQQNSPENIEWMGFLRGEELDRLYQKSRIIVIPGKWYEGFPNVITRAMQHAKPVITSNLGAMASIVDHKKTGLLVQAGSIDALANAIESLYNQPGLCKLYGNNGKVKATEHYSSETIYNKLISIYHSTT